METYSFKLSLTSSSREKAETIARLMQKSLSVIDHDDMQKLLAKAVAKPSIVKTALKFV